MNSYKRHRFPPDIIADAAWLYMWRTWFCALQGFNVTPGRAAVAGPAAIRLVMLPGPHWSDAGQVLFARRFQCQIQRGAESIKGNWHRA